MSFELSGKIAEIFDTEQPSSNFRKREFVIEVEDERGGRRFVDSIKFQLLQDRVDLVDPYSIGDQVKVHFDIKGNRWERDGRVSYFTNLTAWRIERMDASTVETADEDPGFPSIDQAPPEDDPSDDLPF